MLKVGNNIYRHVALTPSQKEQKKDWLLKQTMKSSNKIPSFEEIWKNFLKNPDIDVHHYYKVTLPIEKEIRSRYYERGILNPTYDQIMDLFWDEVAEDFKEEELLDEIRERYNDIVYRLKNELRDGGCWRVITTQEGVDPTKLIGLGIYWSYVKEAAEAHWSKGKHSQEFRFHARIDDKYIDKTGTILANIAPSTGKNEKEIRFFKYSPIYVYNIEALKSNVVTKTIPIEDYRRC